MYPHRIRLRGPWDFEILTSETPVPDSLTQGRMTMPCQLGAAGLAGFKGSLRLIRRFGMPRTLDATEHVWLDCAGAGNTLQVELNEQALGDFAGGFSVEVTRLLRERNELRICLQAESDQAGLFGETALEIRMPAFLRGCRVTRREDGRLIASVQLVSQAAETLELYLIVDRHTVAYRPLRAEEGTIEVEMASDDPVELGKDIEARVELVQGPLVWYTLAAEVAGTIPPSPCQRGEKTSTSPLGRGELGGANP
jgi:hypothetical protein